MKLALVGESGSGKDYIVKVLEKDYGFYRLSFSDQLKKLGVKIFGEWLKKDYPPEEKETPLNIKLKSGEIITKSPREIWLSLNSLREIEDGLFVRMLEEQFNNTLIDNIVISDIRTENEYEWCVDNDFLVIYVNNEKSIHEKNSFDDYARSLKEKADFIIENDMKGERFIHDFMKKEIMKP